MSIINTIESKNPNKWKCNTYTFEVAIPVSDLSLDMKNKLKEYYDGTILEQELPVQFQSSIKKYYADKEYPFTDHNYVIFKYVGVELTGKEYYTCSSKIKLIPTICDNTDTVNKLISKYPTIKTVEYHNGKFPAAAEEYFHLNDNDAANNPLYFNDNLGGVKGVKGLPSYYQYTKLVNHFLPIVLSEKSSKKELEIVAEEHGLDINDYILSKVTDEQLLKELRGESNTDILYNFVMQVRENPLIRKNWISHRDSLTKCQDTDKWPLLFCFNGIRVDHKKRKVIRDSKSRLFGCGNHRTTGSIACNYDITWNLLEIPYDMISNMSYGDLEKFCTLVNPAKKAGQEDSSDGDIARIAAHHIKDNDLYTIVNGVACVDHETDSRLTDWLHQLGVQNSKISSLLKSVSKYIVKNELIETDEKFISYDNKYHSNEERDTIVTELTERLHKNNTLFILASFNSFNVATIYKKIQRAYRELKDKGLPINYYNDLCIGGYYGDTLTYMKFNDNDYGDSKDAYERSMSILSAFLRKNSSKDFIETNMSWATISVKQMPHFMKDIEALNTVSTISELEDFHFQSDD